ncbi:MAG: 30S ribosome-binding factor RbfA [Candidatus Pacebacteria bacterium]|nr:30S ribosome-binding factor RbfA [Candidatus Paceibacterota bacterium]
MTLRQDKVKENIRNIVAQFLEAESNRTSLITVTNTNVSKDLKKATIFISVLPESDEESALNFTKRRRGDIRAYLKKKLDMRTVPFLDFELDYGEKNRQRIDELSQDL